MIVGEFFVAPAVGGNGIVPVSPIKGKDAPVRTPLSGDR